MVFECRPHPGLISIFIFIPPPSLPSTPSLCQPPLPPPQKKKFVLCVNLLFQLQIKDETTSLNKQGSFMCFPFPIKQPNKNSSSKICQSQRVRSLGILYTMSHLERYLYHYTLLPTLCIIRVFQLTLKRLKQCENWLRPTSPTYIRSLLILAGYYK